jgi:zinc protease
MFQSASLGCALVLWFAAISFAAHEPVIVESPGNPLISFRLMFQTGSANDPAGKEGLNALTAMMISDGGTRDLSLVQVIETLYPMAAGVGAQTDREVTTIVGGAHRDFLEDFYTIYRDLLLQPRFDPEDFERNRNQLLNYVSKSLRGSDDEELAKTLLAEMLYREHPFRHPTAWTVAGLESITLDDVKAFYRDRYTFASLRIGLAGDLPEGFAERVQEDFEKGLPAGKESSLELPSPSPAEGIEVWIAEKAADSTAISLGFPYAVTRSDPDFYPLLVANTYLGDHRSFHGVLMNNLRGKRGLNYGDYSYIEEFVQDGGSTFPVPNTARQQQFFSIWLRPVMPENAHFALRAALWELRRLVDTGISEENFEATRDYLLNYSKLWVQTLDRRLGYHIDSQFYGTGYYIDEIERRLGSLTAEDVNRAVKKHLDRWDFRVAMVASNANDLAASLEENRVSPITYQTPGTPPEVLEEDKKIERFELPVRNVTVIPVEELFEK